MSESYYVAFSFAGAERALVRAIAVAVQNILGEGTVFFDEWFEHLLAIPDSDLLLKKIYHERSALVVPCISSTYERKPWTRGEHRAIRELEWHLPEQTPFGDFYKVMPLRVGDGNVENYPDTTTIAPDVRNRTPGSIAKTIVNRLRMKMPNAGRSVYLAPVAGELEKFRERIVAFLGERGWDVLPNKADPVENLQLAERDLKKCRAFVQLLEPGAALADHPLAALAETNDVKMFRYQQTPPPRNGDTAAASDAAAARQADIIHGSFDDFKVHLDNKLKVLRSDPMPIGDWPRVRVALRCQNHERFLDQLYAWFREHRIDPEELGPNDSFEAKHQASRCHGFLVVCDEAALSEGPHSPLKDMAQFRRIHMEEQKLGLPPPVGLLYWQPPPPVWGKLRRGGPPDVHEILGDSPTELARFFGRVKKISQ